MSRDLYAALAGASATWSQLETLSNNLANVSTTGFRAGKVTFRLTGERPELLGQSYVQASALHPSTAQGPIAQDGHALHVAVRGPGWIAVEGPQGYALTRDGRFQLDEDGILRTVGGFAVLGDGAPIRIPPGEHVRIAEDGRVTTDESGELGRLDILDGPVTPLGGNLWQPAGSLSIVEQPSVEQGALEGSNVDALSGMVELIEASRYFEAFEKAMQASDDLDQRLNRMGGT